MKFNERHCSIFLVQFYDCANLGILYIVLSEKTDLWIKLVKNEIEKW